MTVPSAVPAKSDTPRSWWAPEGNGGALVSCVVLVGLAVLMVRNWLGQALPTSFRQEVITELPLTWLFRRELLDGHFLSEWNPYWFSGFQAHRYMSYPLYYVLAICELLGNLGPKALVVCYYLAVTALSGLAMFAYLRSVMRDWRVALVGAALYVTWPNHHLVGVETWIHAAVWVWVPLILWLVERAARQGPRRTRELVLAGIALGGLPLISSEYAVMTAPFLALYICARAVVAIQDERRAWRQELGSWALTLAVAVGTSAFFVLPGLLELSGVGILTKFGQGVFESATRTAHHSVTPALVWYATATRWGLPASWQGLPSIAVSVPAMSWYPGLVAVALAFVGLVALWRDRVSQRESLAVRFVGWAALVGLTLSAVFVSGPEFALNLFQLVPFLRNLSAFRGFLLIGVFLTIMASVGARWLLERVSRAAPRPVVPMLCVIAVVALILGDHWPSATAYCTTPAYFSQDEEAAYAWLRRNAEIGTRLWDQATPGPESYVAGFSIWTTPMARYGGYYDNGAPLHTRLQVMTEALPLATRLRLHQVRYVLLRKSSREAESILKDLQAAGFKAVYENATVQILERAKNGVYVHLYRRVALDLHTDDDACLEALPALLRRNIALVAADSVAHSAITPEEVQRYAMVFADEPPTGESAVSAWVAEDPDRLVTSDTVRNVASTTELEVAAQMARVSYERIYLAVSAPKSGLLTIAESWYPNWRVRVDGQNAQVVRANGALLGVWVESGEHRVEFYCQRPWYVYLGFGVTAFTWLVILCWVSWRLRLAWQRRS
jgi:hypothetical protein